MSGSDITPVDTTGVVGNAGAAPSGTQFEASNADTAAPLLAPRAEDYVSPDVTGTGDTSGALGGATTVPTSTVLTGTVDTLQPGQIGAGDANPVYRAPGGPVNASVLDTTRTNIEFAGSLTNPVPSSYPMTDTPQTADIGALNSGTGLTPPVAPTAVTAITGPRLITVAWTPPAQIANDPTLGFVIQNSAGGVTFAPANATSVAVTNLTPDSAVHLNLDGTTDTIAGYTFRVAARNKAGIGPFSTASTPAIRPYNPDADDAIKPGGLTDFNTLNPIYNPDGTIKAGTGRNTAPVLGAITPGNRDSYQITVNWTAPTGGDTPTSYVVAASDGTTTTSAAGTTSKVVTFATGGQTVTLTVQAISDAGAGAVSAPSAPTLVPGGLNNAPVLGAITPGTEDSREITVNWVAPTLGETQTSYEILASDPDGTTDTALFDATSGVLAFAADEGGTNTTIRVRAVNDVGNGAWSTPSASTRIPGGLNNAPVLGAVTPDADEDVHEITVNWTAPTLGETQTSYVILADDADGTTDTALFDATSGTLVFAADEGGTNTTITVQAINAIGAGTASAPSASTRIPGGLNNAPTIGAVVAGAPASKEVTVNWTAPTLGETPTSYFITASDALTTDTSAAGTTSKVVTFAAAGAAVTFTVHAINPIGAGPESAASAEVTVP